MTESTPRIITGMFRFRGAGYDKPLPLDASLAYTVPPGKQARMVHLRAGNSCVEMITLVLLGDGRPMRLFPVGARAAGHVPLAVAEDLFPATQIELRVAAPEGAGGWVALDMGLMET